MFKIEFSNNSKKFLKKTNKETCTRILARIEKLAENPFSQGCKRIEGRKEKVFRIRIGNCRVLYVLFKEQNTLFISDIDKRSRVYD